MDSAVSGKNAFLAAEYRLAANAIDEQYFDKAWHHLERAHVVAQDRLGPHCVSHWRMLRLAWRLQDWREVSGQLFRLALAPLGNLTGKLPVGNNGRSGVSAFAPMEISQELKDVMGAPTDRSDRSVKG